jgi:hypothetical protein
MLLTARTKRGWIMDDAPGLPDHHVLVQNSPAIVPRLYAARLEFLARTTSLQNTYRSLRFTTAK